MEEDFQTISDRLSHSLSTMVWRNWVINLSILPLDKGCIIWNNEKHQSLIDWLICLVTACWGPHEYQGLEHIRGRARITTTKKQKNTKNKQQQKSKKKLCMIKIVCGAYLSYCDILLRSVFIRKKLIQQRPQKQNGILATLLNFMEGC